MQIARIKCIFCSFWNVNDNPNLKKKEKKKKTHGDN